MTNNPDSKAPERIIAKAWWDGTSYFERHQAKDGSEFEYGGTEYTRTDTITPQQAAKVLLEGGSYDDFADAFAEMGRMIEESENPEVAFFNVMKALAESKDE